MAKRRRPPIRFIQLSRQQRALRRPLLTALARVVDSSRFILGPETQALEARIAALTGARHAVGVNSGTDALVLALRALGIGPGHEVIVPDYTFIATATAVILAGAVPVLADVEPDTLNLGPAAVERLLTSRTRAILPVHLYGQPADLTALTALAKTRNLAVIEDACQALGATWQGRPVGGFGDAGCLSFFPTKNLGALGDAGMVVTQSDELAAHLRRLRDHGAAQKYQHLEVGYNSRLDELQAAALRVKLARFPAWTRRRRHLAARYTEGLAGLGLELPAVRPGAQPVYHLYTLRTPLRDELRADLARQGIETAVHYPLPLHRQPALAQLPSAQAAFPVAERASREVLCLPIAPELTDAEQARVITTIRNFVGGKN